MSFSNTNSVIFATGNNSVSNYSFTFPIQREADLVVKIMEIATGEITDLILGDDYEVEVGGISGGSITLLNNLQDWLTIDGELTEFYKIMIKREATVNQTSDFRNAGAYFAELHEDRFDKQTFFDQDFKEQLDRSAQFDEFIMSDLPDVKAILPRPMAGMLIGWLDDDGKMENVAPVDLSLYYTKVEVDSMQTNQDTALQLYADAAGDAALAAANLYTDNELAVLTLPLSAIQQSGALPGQIAVWNGTNWETQTPVSGVTDHSLLSNLDADDHTQYHDDARGDARYYTKTELDAGELDSLYYTEAEIDSALSANSTGDRSRANHTGSQPLSTISQSGAANGQVPTWNGSAWVPDSSGGGVTDHGALSGLSDDDHSQYHNDARGDARYFTQAQVTTSLAGKANTVHDHPPTQIIRQFGSHESQYLGVGDDGAGYNAAYPMLARTAHVAWWIPNPNAPTATVAGMGNIATQGTATGKSINNQPYEMAKAVPRIGYRVTTAATTAVAAWKPNSNSYYISGASYPLRAGICSFIFGPDTGAAAHTAGTVRCFAGLSNNAGNATDANPDVVAQVVGVGARNTDSNWHVIIRQSGVNTQNIDTGIAKQMSGDDTDLYQLIIEGSFNSTSIKITFRQLLPFGIGSSFTATIQHFDLPDETQLLSPRVYYSVGGTSSVIGMNMAKFYSEQYYAAYSYL